MKGFELDQNGDVVINNDISMVSDIEHIGTMVRTILSTNKGEWFLNSEEGIAFENILKKNPDMDIIKNEIQKGLLQVDSSFVLEEIECSEKDRNLVISFKARNADGKVVEEVMGI